MSIVESDIDVAPTPRYEDLEVTDHALDRWAERSPKPRLDPDVAWLEAIPIDCPSAKPPADRARLHEVTEMILLADPDGGLVTCKPLGDRSRDEQQYIRSQVSNDER